MATRERVKSKAKTMKDVGASENRGMLAKAEGINGDKKEEVTEEVNQACGENTWKRETFLGKKNMETIRR